MKNFIWIPFVLFAGLAVGGWGVRNDLRSAKLELKEARQLIKEGGPGRRGIEITDGVTRLLNIDGGSREGGSERATMNDTGREISNIQQGMSNDEQLTTNNQQPTASSDVPSTEEERKRTMEERIGQAVELWRTRSEIARSTFVNNLNLDDKKATKFDTLVDAMNVRMAHAIETWVDKVEKKEDLRPEDGLRLVNEVTDVMVAAYDDLDREMPEDWRDKTDEKFQVVDFVDPAVAYPLVRVENKLENAGPSDRQRRGGQPRGRMF